MMLLSQLAHLTLTSTELAALAALDSSRSVKILAALVPQEPPGMDKAVLLQLPHHQIVQQAMSSMPTSINAKLQLLHAETMLISTELPACA